MYTNLYYAAQPTYDLEGTASNLGRHAQATALSSYRAATWRGWLSRWLAWLPGRESQLSDLEQVSGHINVRSRHYAGLQAVPVHQIRGSAGRCQDFDAAFNPRNENTRDRWLSIARARALGTALPAIELIQIGDRYFVRDGHHRLSVARSRGEYAVDAEVTVWDVDGPLPWERPTQVTLAPRLA